MFIEELNQYLVDHPVVLASVGVFVLLAVIGAWYVISHHLHAVLTTFSAPPASSRASLSSIAATAPACTT